ncbi:MAG: hypothetical protein CMK87_01530 [Pseudomonadales bacterium]|jgi:hypothetical protein|nr:hypothetical protein [Pseudomonadales bacterium]MAY07259.1 hypothetical protein [Pseudomonadales bacterium]|tara:strand:- start:771 stop:1118 length:348 start_codon:yes stop_codon:yes gene_type:complete
MIFAVETEERALAVFPTQDEAIAYCEGLDVEAATWLFWAADGSPLEAEFITPNKRGWFSVQNGHYRLVPALPEHHADLAEALDEVLRLEPNPTFNSLLQVREYLAKLTNGAQDGA